MKRDMRVEYCEAMSNALMYSPGHGGRKVIVFSNEKWTMSKYHNCRNDAKTKIGVNKNVEFIGRVKKLQKAMSCGLVGTDGFACKPTWIDGTLNNMKYMEILSNKVILPLNHHYGPRNLVLQDGSLATHPRPPRNIWRSWHRANFGRRRYGPRIRRP